MTYPTIDPVLIQFGPLQLRWYGLMYIFGFLAAYFIFLRGSKKGTHDLSKKEIGDLLTYCIAGLVIGARLGYCLFYNFSYYLHHPLKILAVWEGGMSFHGGALGVLIVGWIFSIRNNKPFFTLADLGALAAPIGLFFGRIGNFINGELYGRKTDVPWGMVFPGAGDFPRHPSQLYEALLEGLVLFLILFLLSRRRRARGFLFGTFLSGYGLFRFLIEFYREPDPQLGFVLGPFTMGQILCAIMMACGVYVVRRSRIWEKSEYDEV
ncbi:prolipoprotein diacylglyceryl transferase [Thermodesulfobacteriota bacterium]